MFKFINKKREECREERRDEKPLTPREKAAAHFRRPAARERTLTLPLAPSTLPIRRKQKTKEQLQSALLRKLPAEVRLMIWEYAIADDKIHILQKKLRLRHMPCGNIDAFSKDTLASVYTGFHNCEGYEGNYGNVMRLDNGAQLLSLLKSCRQIYTEAVDVLYTRTIFRIEDVDTLSFFSTMTLPHRFNSIGYLHLLWFFHVDIFENTSKPPHDLATWENTCNILASMEGLVELDIELSTGSSYWKRDTSPTKLLQSMKHIKAKKRFDVRVWAPWPWLRDMEKEVLQSLPFRVLDTNYFHTD